MKGLKSLYKSWKTQKGWTEHCHFTQIQDFHLLKEEHI